MPTLPIHLSQAHATGLPATSAVPAPRTATTDTGGLIASDPIFSGTGWRAAIISNVYCLSPSQQYTVTFPTQALKDRYVPYLTAAVNQLITVGVKLEIGGIETPD
ncbi:hypothetical protein [Streptomyces sp. CA2R101]|uniref:hypothetical protein n=1 Tax=Streptomyces sp. CA2R101 TaxID=3120152 RepID=UPI003008D4EA